MKQLMMLFFSFCFSLGIHAQENNDALLKQALNAFNEKEYAASAQIFEKLVKIDSLNAALHYNLGTSYLRMQNTALSIYHLEKALKLQPDYEAARINLNFAEKLKTKVTKGNLPIPQQQMLYSVFNFLKPNAWAYLAIASMFLTVILLVVYRLNANATAKKALFTLSIFTLAISIGSYFISKNQSDYLLMHHYVIVKDADAVLMNEPRTVAKVSATLIEGEKGFIQEATNQWIKIQLPNDTIGWVDKNKVLQY
ncbi:tetratricopeptide repeat protein [Flavobacterium sp. CBA20B-1]|uniref:tetratricopeptide repeat protein n=1 Tax=unclassified Flavobacterium TaxID=196869 RepID=UPI002224FC6F|nr:MULTISPECIES: tetratricopeptide repeat protein [unclassified Flavobacterium]WCM41348.1 tetratricopeptide repeat protein [Flavobacterium sp. CBA20B-1]